MANDQQAWEQMVGLYYPMVYGWCRRSGLQSSDAADVCQDVFRGVVRGIGGFRRDKPGDTFRGWLRRITQRRVIDHRQARQSQAEPLLELGSRVPRATSAHPPGDELPESVKEPSLPHGVLDLVRQHRPRRSFRDRAVLAKVENQMNDTRFELHARREPFVLGVSIEGLKNHESTSI